MKSHILINKSKATIDGEMPVMVVIQEGKRKLQIRTGLTTKTMFKGCEFPDNERNARAKTARLRKVLAEVEEYILLHQGETFEAQSTTLKEIITGKKSKAYTLAELIEQFAAAKDREYTGRQPLRCANTPQRQTSKPSQQIGLMILFGFAGRL